MKLDARLACHTTLMLDKKNVPRLPWSDERFHTPGILVYTCSSGRRSSWIDAYGYEQIIIKTDGKRQMKKIKDLVLGFIVDVM